MAELFRLPPKRVWPNGRCVIRSGRPLDHWNSYPAVEGAGCDERPRSAQQREYVGIASLYSPPIPKPVCPGFQSSRDVRLIVSDPNVIDVKALTEARITLKTEIVEKVPASPPLVGPDLVVFPEESELDEPAFIDAVSRNLRLGRILLLIVGDGIREGVETLTAYLQLHAGFHFALGIVEVPIFELPQQGFLVQPRLLARTVNIERGIVRLVDGQIRIEPPENPSIKITTGQRTSISEDQLRERLQQSAPEVPGALDRFLTNAEELGVHVEPATKSLQIRWRGPDEVIYGLGGIDENGRLLTNSVNWKPNKIGRVDLSHQYIDRLASLIGGQVRETKSPTEWYVVRDSQKTGYNESLPEAITILSRSTEWLEAIRWYTGELSSAIESRSA